MSHLWASDWLHGNLDRQVALLEGFIALGITVTEAVECVYPRKG
tara:strand:+ start:21492 stop:21623 length:132 start_codon:yes stop_codon:yes gene_type:complete